MAKFVLKSPDIFPVGTSVAVYPQSNWSTALLPPSGAPVGSATETQTVAADGTATYVLLAVKTRYFAAALVGGVWRYVSVMVGDPALFASPQYDRDNGEPGIYAPGVSPGRASIAVVASRAYVARFVPSRPMSITLIAFNVTVAASLDDACDVGIYDAALNRLVSAGATAGKLNATGIKTIPVALGLQAQTVYYAAFSVGTIGGTAASLDMTLFQANGGLLMGAAVPNIEQTFMAAAHPLPATITAGGGIGSIPVLAVRES